MNLLPKFFFDLSDFSWSDVFIEDSYVWESLKNINAFIDEKLRKQGENKLILGEGSIIQDTARIEGTAVIGKNCTIGHGALLRGGVVIGDNVTIGHGAEVKHSIVLNSAAIAHLNYVGDSIVGSGVNISGGAILANWRFDKKNIKIHHENQAIETGMEKCGGFIGDGSTIGVNAVLNPGTLLGRNSLVFPLVSVKGFHPEGSVIKS
jgi:NDP-sugar pyrophosphorylase family protein